MYSNPLLLRQGYIYDKEPQSRKNTDVYTTALGILCPFIKKVFVAIFISVHNRYRFVFNKLTTSIKVDLFFFFFLFIKAGMFITLISHIRLLPHFYLFCIDISQSCCYLPIIEPFLKENMFNKNTSWIKMLNYILWIHEHTKPLLEKAQAYIVSTFTQNKIQRFWLPQLSMPTNPIFTREYIVVKTISLH